MSFDPDPIAAMESLQPVLHTVGGDDHFVVHSNASLDQLNYIIESSKLTSEH